MIKEPINDNKDRIKLLDKISSDLVSEIDNSTEWVGILKKPIIKDIIFRPKLDDGNGYTLNKTFFWECRIDFLDNNMKNWSYGNKVGLACKDKRFKSYWRDLMLSREEKYNECKEKWIKYMQENDVYLLIEFIPNNTYGTIAMVSGVFCIKTTNEVI